MDSKQALQQRGSPCTISINHKNPTPASLKSNEVSSTCRTRESSKGSSHDSSPVFLYSDHTSAHSLHRFDADNPRFLKLSRFHDDPPSPHDSSSLETQALINLHGSSNNSSLTYLSNSAHNSNHPSPTSNFQSTSSLQSNTSFNGGQQLYFSFNGGALSRSPLSKLYSLGTSTTEDSISQQPLMLSASNHTSTQGALCHLSTVAKNHNVGSLYGLNTGTPPNLFTPEQLLELTQQTYVFKHFAAGVPPPPVLLLPIINSVASSLSRGGARTLHFDSNADLSIYAGSYNVAGSLRGHLDLEPGRCRRTDGKKWRCARDVVPDQKYCERHMHRGRHRARSGKPTDAAMASIAAVSCNTPMAEPLNTCESANLSHVLSSQNNVLVTSNTSSSLPTTSSSTTVGNEPRLPFSLQQQRPSSTDIASRSLGAILSESRNAGVQPPNLAELLKGSYNSSVNGSDPKSQRSALAGREESSMEHVSFHASQPAFPFSTCPTPNRDAADLALRQFVDTPPAPPMSWIDQFAEEQSSKRYRFNTELSMATHLSNSRLRLSPLSLSSSKLGSDLEEETVEIPNYMGLSTATSSKQIKEPEDSYGSIRTTWVPIAWDNPSLGGPLAEALQSNGANCGSKLSGSLDNYRGKACLNLIEEISWDQDEHGSSSVAKDSHSPASLASPTGVLQIKASYSDSSSSASSPRSSALKLESAANLAI